MTSKRLKLVIFRSRSKGFVGSDSWWMPDRYGEKMWEGNYWPGDHMERARRRALSQRAQERPLHLQDRETSFSQE